MLFLSFKLGNDRYAMEVSRVVEIVPLVMLKQLSDPPPGVAGVFNYRGQLVTAIDLCELILHRPAENRLSTRIIIVKNPAGGGKAGLVGLIAEEATGVLNRERTDFVNPPPGSVSNPVGTPVLFDTQGPIHLLDETRLLSDSFRDQLAHVAD